MRIGHLLPVNSAEALMCYCSKTNIYYTNITQSIAKAYRSININAGTEIEKSTIVDVDCTDCHPAVQQNL